MYRPAEATNVARRYKIYVDGKKVGAIGVGKTVEIAVPAGQHTVKAGPGRLSSQAEAGMSSLPAGPRTCRARPAGGAKTPAPAGPAPDLPTDLESNVDSNRGNGDDQGEAMADDDPRPQPQPDGAKRRAQNLQTRGHVAETTAIPLTARLIDTTGSSEVCVLGRSAVRSCCRN